MWIYLRTSYRRDSILSYVFALRSFMRIDHRISPAKVSLSKFISAVETEWNRIAHLSQSSTASSSTDRKIEKDLFPCQEAIRSFLLAWFPEFHDTVVEKLSSKDHLNYHEAIERILNLPSNHRSPSGAASMTSKPQYESNAISSSNRKKKKKKKNGSSSFSNSGSKECNRDHMHSPGTATSHIWTWCKELKPCRERNGAEATAPV
jgi:hypothetical protein